VLKALVVPGQLRRARHVLLRKYFPLLYLGHHNACSWFDCKKNGFITTIYSRSQLLTEPDLARESDQKRRCGEPKLPSDYESDLPGAYVSPAMLSQSQSKRSVTKQSGGGGNLNTSVDCASIIRMTIPLGSVLDIL
jgi:hypothetical protein